MITNNLNNKTNNINPSRLSEMVQDIISSKPSFIIRYGTLFFLFTILLLVIICWFIQYPDIITTSAQLKSINAPKQVVTKSNGKLIRLFAKEDVFTKQGEVLGYVESIASHYEVIRLSNDIDSVQERIGKGKIEELQSFLTSSFHNLGELQQSYQVFISSYQLFNTYLSDGFYLKKRVLLLKDVEFLKKMNSNLLQQKNLIEQDLQLSQKTFEANESLKNDKVISEFDYRNEASKYIIKKITLPEINSAILNIGAQQNEKEQEIAELENTISQQKNIFSQSVNTFKSLINDWKKKYLIISPIDGKIEFATFLQEGEELQINQVLCYINPKNTEYYAEILIPQTNFGKVKTNQEVLLKFPSYPFQQYGSVIGSISFISNISSDSGYLAKVTLPYGLKTNYHNQVQYRDGLLAQGEIITENMRLLQRFYYNLKKKVKR